MPRNVEIKAQIESVRKVALKVAAIADSGPIEIYQDDTFFDCRVGRLKLRAFSKESGELIFYRRADCKGPKESFYLRSPTAAPDTLRECLTHAYGQVGRVHKQRLLFFVGRTRVHLDIIEGLGHFIELEVVLEDHELSEIGIREADALMVQFEVPSSKWLEVAYVDLLAQRTANASASTTQPHSEFFNIAPRHGDRC